MAKKRGGSKRSASKPKELDSDSEEVLKRARMGGISKRNTSSTGALKTKPKISAKQRAAIFKDEGIIEDSGTIICSICGFNLSNSKFLIEQHLVTEKHKVNKSTKEAQQTISGINVQKSFYKDVCTAFVGANIPLRKLNHPSLKKFFRRYLNRSMPEESTIRKNYLEETYEETLQNIRADIKDHPIWVSIDETTDAEGRYIANVIVGALKLEEAGRAYLLHTAHLEVTNSQTIAKTLNEAFQILWPEGIHHDRVLLLVTDAAAYMKKAGRDLTVLYTKMIHMTCLAHAIHRLADCIRGHFKKADKLISAVKKVFLKAPSRIAVLKRMHPNIPLPPEPILTRWGTWIRAVSYYAKYWNEIRDVVSSLPNDDAVAIREAQELFTNPEVFQQITFVEKHYSFIPNSITKLETAGLSLHQSLQILADVIQKISGTPKPEIREKFSRILSSNPGLSAINAINSNDKEKMSKFPQLQEMSPAELSLFAYAPVVSCEVERSFSRYKTVLVENRRSFKFPNLKFYCVILCNNHSDSDPNENESDTIESALFS